MSSNNNEPIANAADAKESDANAADDNAGDANAADDNAGDAKEYDANAGDAKEYDANAADANAADAKESDANAADANAADANAADDKESDEKIVYPRALGKTGFRETLVKIQVQNNPQFDNNNKVCGTLFEVKKQINKTFFFPSQFPKLTNLINVQPNNEKPNLDGGGCINKTIKNKLLKNKNKTRKSKK